jgi:hypothetical protein
MRQPLPTPHGDKLRALLLNSKLPSRDVPRVEQAIERYQRWTEALYSVEGADAERLRHLVSLFNDYKYYIEIDLIFDSPQNFLYRQKGQLKLDNTIIEEFLPILVTTVLIDHFGEYDLVFGPTRCFSELRFESSITAPKSGGGMRLREKDHDFAISRPLYLQASYRSDFTEALQAETHVAYAAAECKTNLDKTMFQEAAATALDIKRAVPSAKYYLLCDWLDMTPINSSTTAIDEIIILRQAKRISSNIRGTFSTAEGRQEKRELFTNYLKAHPFSVGCFSRFLKHIKDMIEDTSADKVLRQGYF